MTVGGVEELHCEGSKEGAWEVLTKTLGETETAWEVFKRSYVRATKEASGAWRC